MMVNKGMSFFSCRDKGCKVLGKDLKTLFDYPSGVLVLRDRDIHFIPFQDLICRVIPKVCKGLKEKRVLISNEFDKVKGLDDNQVYFLCLCPEGLEVWNETKDKLIMVIDGVVH